MALEQSLRRNFFSSWLQTQKMERVGTSARSDGSLEHRELVPCFSQMLLVMGRGLRHVAGVSRHHTCPESRQGGGSVSAILSLKRPTATKL